MSAMTIHCGCVSAINSLSLPLSLYVLLFDVLFDLSVRQFCVFAVQQ